MAGRRDPEGEHKRCRALAYVIAEETTEDTISVSEVRVSRAAHDASLTLAGRNWTWKTLIAKFPGLQWQILSDTAGRAFGADKIRYFFFFCFPGF